MPGPTSVKTALASAGPIPSIQVQGWVRTRRDSKDFCFIELNDGSCLKNLQIIVEADLLSNYEVVKVLGTGSSIAVEGELVPSPGAGQKWELKAHRIDILGTCPDTY